MMNEPFEHGKPENDLPPRFQKAMEELKREQVLVTAEVDQAILEHSREHLRGVAARKQRSFGVTQWLKLAAAFATAGFLVWAFFTPLTKPQKTLTADVDRNGRVDIVDAFELARWVKTGNPRRFDFDFNEDGKIDERDVDAIAGVAVQLNQGGV